MMHVVSSNGVVVVFKANAHIVQAYSLHEQRHMHCIIMLMEVK
jgi:hypothetical protein